MSADGHVVFRRRVARDGILALLTRLPPCAAAMEAGGAPGAVMLAEAGLLEPLLGLPATLLLPFALTVRLLARQTHPSRGLAGRWWA